MGFNFPKPRKRLTRALLASGVALAGAASLVFTQVTPALADPTTILVAVGSDTVQDVYNQFSVDASGNLLGSYNAINPQSQAAHEIITPVDGTASGYPTGTVTNPANTNGLCGFQRPNGSSEGVEALQASINPTTTYPGFTGLTGTAVPQPGCVDIARSSSGVAQQSNTGAIVYIPFAEDAVAGSTGPTACTGTACAAYNYTYTGATDATIHTVSATPVPTNITHANLFTMVDILNLYANCATVTEGGVTYNPGTATAGQQQIDLYIPQSGSGTAKFWAKTFGNFSLSSLPACVHQTIVGGLLATATGGVPVEEHNGTPMATDPNGFGPFSVAQWIAQNNGHFDRRHTAQVLSMEACTTPLTTTSTCSGSPIPPYNTVGGSLVLNYPGTATAPGFPIVRQVFSVTSFARVTNTSDPLYTFLNNASAANTLCSDGAAISSYGFAQIASCGSVLTANRGND